jgi:glycosyltransferase involved in cell wall biosynthesis
MRRLLLISNKVMHYRVSIYNYFYDEFQKDQWDLIIRSNELDSQNPYILKFDYKEVDFHFKNYISEINEIKPDVVILFLHLKDYILWPLVHWLKLKKIPIVFWTKGMNLDKPNDWFSLSLYRYLHRLFDKLILYSEYELRFINQKYHPKITVANNAINSSDFPVINESKSKIKKQFNIDFNKIVLFVGRMGIAGGRKKVHHLIEVFNELDRDDIGLIIVGSGLNEELKDRLNENNIRYLGEIHDAENIQISKIFKMSDIYCVPGHVGLGLNQAMYWGLPVITEKGKQPPEFNYLVNNHNGFIVGENDLSQLKERILFLLDNDDIRETFSRNAREYILKNASVKNMFNGFKNCIDSFEFK